MVNNDDDDDDDIFSIVSLMAFASQMSLSTCGDASS